MTKLENLKSLLQTLNSGIVFIYDERSLIIGYQIMFGDDENRFASDPIYLDWPIQHLPIPEAMKGNIN